MASEDSNADTAAPPPPAVKPSSKPAASHEQPTPTELLSSAKVVAGAATSVFNNQSDKLDKAAVAGATADLLGGASQYGNLGEGKFGQYVSQAETYLDNYSGSADSAGRSQAEKPADQGEKPAADASGGEADSGGGGPGGYLKKAQGFLK